MQKEIEKMNRIRVIIPSVILAAVLFMLPACGNSKNDPAKDARSGMSTEDRTDVNDRSTDGNSGGLDRDGDGVADEMEKGGKDVADGAKDAVDGVADGAKDIADGAVDGVKDAADGVADAMDPDKSKNDNTVKNNASNNR